MTRILLAFVLMCAYYPLQAQQSKTSPDSPTSGPAFKQQGKSRENPRKKTATNPATSPTVPTPPVSTAPRTIPAPDQATGEIMRKDFGKMTPAVQSKINQNKLQGKPLMEGIAKAFTIEVKSCHTVADQKRIFSFMKKEKNFIRSEFISDGIVQLIVEPSFDSALLKDLMASKNIPCNFLNRLYLLKN